MFELSRRTMLASTLAAYAAPAFARTSQEISRIEESVLSEIRATLGRAH
jgi:hypothetical protein